MKRVGMLRMKAVAMLLLAAGCGQPSDPASIVARPANAEQAQEIPASLENLRGFWLSENCRPSMTAGKSSYETLVFSENKVLITTEYFRLDDCMGPVDFRFRFYGAASEDEGTINLKIDGGIHIFAVKDDSYFESVMTSCGPSEETKLKISKRFEEHFAKPNPKVFSVEMAEIGGACSASTFDAAKLPLPVVSLTKNSLVTGGSEETSYKRIGN